MFPLTDNPAKRLLEILNTARGIPENMVISAVFGQIFGFPHTDKVTFYRAIGYLNNLVDQIEFRVRQLPSINHELYLRDIPSLRAVISPNGISDQWGNYCQPLKYGALTSLEFCVDELSKSHDEVVVSDQQLTELKVQIEALHKSVLQADLDMDLKAVIIDMIMTIRLSIDFYRIQGADGIKRAVVYCAGLVQMHENRFKGKEEKPTIKQVSKLMSDLVTIIKTAYKVKELGPVVTGLWLKWQSIK